MSVRFQIDTSVMEQVQQRLGQFSHRAPGAISSALNRAMTTVATAIKNEARKEFHVKAGAINKTISKKKASKANLIAAVHSTGSPIGLNEFKVAPKSVNPRRKGQLKVAVKVGGFKGLNGAFNIELNGIKVFKRNGKFSHPENGNYSERVVKRGPKKGQPLLREQIDRLFGPSVPQMVDDEHQVDNISKAGRQMFNNRIEHEINRILGQLGAS